MNGLADKAKPAILGEANARSHNWLELTVVVLCRGSSEEDSPWTREDFNALQAERNAVEEELLEHLAGQDVDQLKWRAVSFNSEAAQK